MTSPTCTVCALDAKPRKLIESVVRAGLSIRDAADFAEFWGTRNATPIKISKSALSRHKTEGHFQSELSVEIELDGTILSVREYAQKIFEVYQKANKGKVPSTKEVIDFLTADAKLADLEARRKDEQELSKLIGGTAYKKPTGENVVEATEEGVAE
jgi:hypothetical protein